MSLRNWPLFYWEPTVFCLVLVRGIILGVSLELESSLSVSLLCVLLGIKYSLVNRGGVLYHQTTPHFYSDYSLSPRHLIAFFTFQKILISGKILNDLGENTRAKILSFHQQPLITYCLPCRIKPHIKATILASWRASRGREAHTQQIPLKVTLTLVTEDNHSFVVSASIILCLREKSKVTDI